MTDSYQDENWQHLEDYEDTKLGLMTNGTWYHDPRRLTFMLSRYKFVSKMLVGCESALEVGCGDAFGSRIVQQEVNDLTVIDIEPKFIKDIEQRNTKKWKLKCMEHDILDKPLINQFGAAYSLDVLEHIPQSMEDKFIENVKLSVRERGIVILGMPSLESQQYASALSKPGHINCKTGPEFKELALKHFPNAFLFSMNDEVLHTGFTPMSQYLFVLCIK